MPTYEYKCYVCNNIFDVEQRMIEAPLKTCKFCGGPVHRVISAASVIFKGSGFHVTDYGQGVKAPSLKPEHKRIDDEGKKSSSGHKHGPTRTETRTDADSKKKS